MARLKKTTKEHLVDFWSRVLQDQNADMKDRFKASELLAKLILSAESESADSTIRFEFDEKISGWGR